MSRSRKKNRIRGITTDISEKQDKRDANRKYRRMLKQFVKSGREDLPLVREVSDVWVFGKDGKVYDKNMTDRDLGK